jgi:hypothetical protein
LLKRLLIVVLLLTAVRAEVMVAQSLDWLVCSCPTVAEATIGEVQQNVFTLELKNGGALQYKSFVPPGSRGDAVLVFARGDLIVDVINLKNPPTRGETAAYTKDFRVLETGPAILEYVRKVKRRGTESKKVEVPTGSEAFKALYSGSTCYLIVPR